MARASRDVLIFDELHSRYGLHIARRVREQLTSMEFGAIAPGKLSSWLGTRAETAHKEYEARLENPFLDEESGTGDYLTALYRRWQDAEELATIIAIAENASTRAAGGK